jgi:hypothetical protein
MPQHDTTVTDGQVRGPVYSTRDITSRLTTFSLRHINATLLLPVNAAPNAQRGVDAQSAAAPD